MAINSDTVTCYTCQINKGDIWFQFENNEKNLPDGAAIQKNEKQILKP